jgi:hypothetical protein
MRIQFNLLNNKAEELFFYKKLYYVAKKRHTSIDLLAKSILLNNIDDLNEELNFWTDKSDDEFKHEVEQELSKIKTGFTIQIKKIK